MTKEGRLEQPRVETSRYEEFQQCVEDEFPQFLGRPEERSSRTRLSVVPSTDEHLRLPGETTVDSDSGLADRAVTMRVTDTQVTLLRQSDTPSSVQPDDVYVASVLMKRSLIARLAPSVLAETAAPHHHFTDLHPVDAAAEELWQNTVSYVKGILLADDGLATSLVLGNAGKLLAAVALSAFPCSIVSAPTPDDHSDELPELLRQAIAFMDAKANGNIALADIAEAVHITPRALQYMFRRHLDTTPLQYLRRMRLSYAHVELLAGDRMQETVTAIATRWGFMHTGRFAVLYRENYGQSPHATLRS